jgi:hypothetical protein
VVCVSLRRSSYPAFSSKYELYVTKEIQRQKTVAIKIRARKWQRYKKTKDGALYRVFQKELYNGIPNVTVWRVLRKRLHLKAYKLSTVQGVVTFGTPL